MKRSLTAALAALLLFAGAVGASAADDPLAAGATFVREGKLEAAAAFYARYAQAHPTDKKHAPEALAWSGRLLDLLADRFSGAAERHCYWGKRSPRSTACMEGEAQKLNARFGAGAFQSAKAIAYLPYTGVHYRTLIERFPKSDFATEAHFFLLLHALVGKPEKVLPRVRAFCRKHRKAAWKRRCQLLWARVNQDIWHVHREWSWVLYNDRISAEEGIIRSEPYRQEALRTYKKLMRKKDAVGKAAAREYQLLDDYQDDGQLLSIVNDSSPGTLFSWGVFELPPAARKALSGGQPSQSPRGKKAQQKGKRGSGR